MEEIFKKMFHDVIRDELKASVEEIRNLNNVPEILTLKETADFLKVSPDWLRKNIKPYKIPFFKIGTDYRFRKKQLLEWVDDNIEILSKYKSKNK